MTRAATTLVLLLLGETVGAQEAFTLRYKPLDKGHVSNTEFQTRVRLNLAKWDETGKQLLDELKVMKLHVAFSTTTLETNGKLGGTSRRHISKSAMSIDGGDEKPDDLQGKTMILVQGRDGSQIALSEEGDPLPEDLLARLASKSPTQGMGKNDEITPKKPVKVGETWAIDAASWVKREDAEIVPKNAFASLTRVYRKEGHLYGVVEAKAEFEVKSLTVQGRKMKLQPGSRIIMKSVRDGCIDGTSWNCVERGQHLFTAVVHAPGPDGLETKMDQQIEITLTDIAK